MVAALELERDRAGVRCMSSSKAAWPSWCNLGWSETADPQLPVVLTAHCSVQGAAYGAERTVMLGSDLVLSG